MWKTKDCNKTIGMTMKIHSYQRHINSLKKIKSQINISMPFQPSFSLSKRYNRYQKFQENRNKQQNTNLLWRMIKMENEPLSMTVNKISPKNPSSKQTHTQIKEYERKTMNNKLNKQNMTILSKLEGIRSQYNSIAMDQEWQKNREYFQNIINKQCITNLASHVKYKSISSKSRPKTAYTTISS